MSEYPTLSNEQILFEEGHTLSLIDMKDYFLGYLGHVDFRGIDIYRINKDFSKMEKIGKINHVRWGAAIKLNNGFIRLYFTRQLTASKLPFTNPYRYQKICMSHTQNGTVFSKPKVFDNATAPFPFRDEHGKLGVALHLHNPHRILVKAPESYLELLIFGKVQTISAPSILYFKDRYWLTVEAQRIKHGNWATWLYSGKSLLGIEPIKDMNFLYDGACCFQHLFGNRLIITYSKRGKNGWQIWRKEATV